MAFQKLQYFTKKNRRKISDNARSQYTQHLRGNTIQTGNDTGTKDLGSVQSLTRNVVPLFP